MHNFSKKINERIVLLERIIKDKRRDLAKAPNGHLNIARSEKRIQYYYKDASEDKKKTYIKKENEALVKALCQKDYDEKVLDAAEKEYKFLNSLCKLYAKGCCEGVYEKLHADRKRFVTPIVLSDEEFIAKWQEENYVGKGFLPNTPEYYTDKGERVRSKSEILIANALNKHGIPYKYEAPLFLEGYGTIHPDFTVLNVRERKTYYFEHLGMMDDAEYVEKALYRISMYERNGIFPGKELILSHETSKYPMNPKNVEHLIEKYLL